jgi:hypothetical protein
MSSTITINGVSYTGSSISISNGVVSINGKNVTPHDKIIDITVTGNIDDLRVDSCQKIDVTGNVKNVDTVSGDVRCGNVSGNVETTSGDIKCGNVGGDVETVSGDVEANEIKGKVSTLSGDVNT